jgi:glycosyltransferase involved in cell wall biosynthesis
MGRIVRGVLRAAASRGDIDVTLLTRERRAWPDDPEAALLATLRFAHPASARRRGAYDVVWYPWNGIRFGATAPALAHIHDTFALQEDGNWIARRRVCKPLWRAAREADRIATDSAWSRAQIERDLRVRSDRIVVIPLAPDPFFCVGDDPDDSAGPLPSEPYVLMVGGAEARKNARFLVAAFSEAFPQAAVRLVVVGELCAEAEREACARGVKLDRERCVDDRRLRALYRGAACVVVPSLAEGFGLVAAEAQACGAPVVASDAAALPEAAGDAALLIPPRDRAAWRDGLREVIEDASVASRLRALGAARWGFAARDAPARAILAVLHDLADQRA